MIADLARWQDWSVIDTLATLFAEAGTDNIFVREPVVNYLRVCPLPEAAEALARCEAIDPEAVRRAATLAGFAGGFAPPNSAAAAADPANSAATAADPASSGGDEDLARQVPPVLADTDATDDTPAIDPSLAVADAAAASDGAATAETRSSATNAVGETPEPPIAWGRWLIWAAIVVAVGLLARVAMRPRAGVTQS